MKKLLDILKFILNPFVLGFLLMGISGIIINYTAGGFWVFFSFLGIPIGFIVRLILNKKL